VELSKLREVLTRDEADRVADVFTTHQRFIEAVASRYAPSYDHVPDIVQAVGVEVCRGLNGFRAESEITTWLFRVTVNTARNYYRHENRQTRKAEALAAALGQTPDIGIDPDDAIAEEERKAALEEAITQLHPKHRRAIRNQLQSRGVSCSSKWTRLRARRRLRRLLTGNPRLD
jgi:RNA polymerase sigma-70 factor, ECF subfamily